MRDIQLSALALGIAVIVCVLAYNYYLDYRHKKMARALLKRGAPKEVEHSTREIPSPDVFLVDPHFEWSARFKFPKALTLADLFSTSTRFIEGIQKRITWVAWDASRGEWRFVYTGGATFPIEYLHVNLQLCSRSGAASPSDIEHFARFVKELGKHFGAEYRLSDLPVEDIAREMDHFCAEVDLEIAIKLLAEKPFPLSQFKTWALSTGMQYQNQMGDYALFDSNGNLRYRVEIAAQSGENIQSLHFVLDVPCTAQGEEIFKVMVADAHTLAEETESVLVDDKNTPLSAVQLENIAAQFVALPQEKMKKAGIPAGSPQARRLFS